MTRILELANRLLERLRLDRFRGRGKTDPIEIQNPMQNLITHFTREGIEVSPLRLRPGMAGWRLALRTRGLGRGGCIEDLGRPLRSHDEARITFRHSRGLTETYENPSTGIEQRFVLQSRPGGDGEVTIAIAVSTDLTPYAGTTKRYVRFTDGRGAPVLTLDRAVVRDSKGRLLKSSVELVEGELRMQFRDEGAEYPVWLSPPPMPEALTVMPSPEAESSIKARPRSLPSVS